MHDILFYIFALMTLASAFLVVANPFSRNPVTNAMFLVLTIVSMAGLYVLLNAYFLAAVQILVYAGAVMVLFLFVVMMLDLKEEEKRKTTLFGLISGLIAVVGLLGILLRTVWLAPAGKSIAPSVEGSAIELGKLLFNFKQSSPGFLLPFEIVSLVLLVAMVGVILLSKKELK